jgi:hypothetical protein
MPIAIVATDKLLVSEIGPVAADSVCIDGDNYYPRSSGEGVLVL